MNVVGDALLNTNNGQKVKKSVALTKEDACSMTLYLLKARGQQLAANLIPPQKLIYFHTFFAF